MKSKIFASAGGAAVCAVMTALLIAVQLALGFVAGVELVTVLFLVFCYTFGAVYGVFVATAFSLLRCMIWGFYPVVVLLYLIYYNAFALLFGSIGKRGKPVATWICPTMVGILLAACAFFGIRGVPVSALYQGKIRTMLWILFGILLAILLLYVVMCGTKKGEEGREIASVTALATVCTVFFTLLDDVLTPLLLGYSFDAAVAYFYAGFTAMLPQCICTAVSVATLFYPLKKIFRFAAKKAVKNLPLL